LAEVAAYWSKSGHEEMLVTSPVNSILLVYDSTGQLFVLDLKLFKLVNK
jgi:hypothetical protein